ncbi:MAG: M23 family metallopeptidase [Pyrinomonadaceae bacterium]
MHFGSVGIFLILGITTFAIGISGIVRNTAFAESLSKTSALSHIAFAPIKIPEPITQPQPAASGYAFNSGGPEEGSEVDGETSEIDAEIASIRKNADPAYLPTMWAHLGKINNEFGFRRNPFGGRAYEFHPGMDIDGERGDLVTAPANGIVISAGYKGGYGNMIEIDHGNGLTTRYGHLSKIEIAVGDTITRSQLIGYIGSTGRSTGPHLHFELRLNDKSINPRHFLVPEPTDLNTIAK